MEQLVEQIKPILAGKHPSIQGAVLADCLAIWLAGHPKELRDDLLKMHIEKVAELVPVNAALILVPIAAEIHFRDTPMKPPPDAVHLGDGAYASNDGICTVWLWAEREDGWHHVALEIPSALEALNNYVKSLVNPPTEQRGPELDSAGG